MYESVSGYVNCRRSAHWGGKRTLDPPELELQGAVIHLIWMLGNAPGSSGRAASAQLLSHLTSTGL